MKRLKIRCPYCGSLASKRPASYIYGESADKNKYLFVCDCYPKCNSYVAATEKGQPMGTLANKELRQKRIAAHKSIDRIWKKGFMTKEQVYVWLQSKLNMTDKEMHIGKFGIYYCNRVIYECNRAYRNMRILIWGVIEWNEKNNTA